MSFRINDEEFSGAFDPRQCLVCSRTIGSLSFMVVVLELVVVRVVVWGCIY